MEAGSEQQFLTPLPGRRGQPRAAAGLTGKFREACFCAQARMIVNICSESDVRFSIIFQKGPQGTPRTQIWTQKDGQNSTSHQFGIRRILTNPQNMIFEKSKIQNTRKVRYKRIPIYGITPGYRGGGVFGVSGGVGEYWGIGGVGYIGVSGGVMGISYDFLMGSSYSFL